MATKKDLEREVRRLNIKHSFGRSNELDILQSNGGYSVVLRAKRYKNGKPYLGSKVGYGNVSITNGQESANKTLASLEKRESKGWVKESFKNYQRRLKRK